MDKFYKLHDSYIHLTALEGHKMTFNYVKDVGMPYQTIGTSYESDSPDNPALLESAEEISAGEYYTQLQQAFMWAGFEE